MGSDLSDRLVASTAVAPATLRGQCFNAHYLGAKAGLNPINIDANLASNTI